jgi:alpha-2-macroglobulin
MNNQSWKKLAIGIIAIGIVAVGVFYFTSGKSSKQPAVYINPAFAEYISSYTAGVISSGASVRIILAKDVADSTLIGRDAGVKLFQFAPAIKGKAVWLDARTIEFKPDTRLTSGQVYEVNFLLSKIMNVPADMKSFVYTFQVIPQNFEASIENIKPYVKTELTRQKIEGVINTADFAENELVEKILFAKQSGTSLKINWSHTSNGKQHHFSIEDVVRKESAGKVELSLDGAALGVKRTDKLELEIPALGDFKLMNAKVVQNPNQYVVLQFSDPLKEKQNLQGLISIASLASLEFDIHDNEIWVYPPVRQTGTKTIRVEVGVRNILDYRMSKSATWDVLFEQLKPEVRITGKGVILPSTDGLVLPFEAVSLRAVDVEIVRIFESNVLQFLQVNDLDGDSELRRVGKKLIKQTISLENSGVTDLGKWNRFTFDLSKFITPEPGAIYQVKLSFKKAYSAYFCDDDEETTEEEFALTVEDEFLDDGRYGYYDSYDYYYDDDDFDWDERDNPCHSSYYVGYNRRVTKNVLASDLGLLAKRGSDGKTTIFVTDLKTAQPVSGVTLELYNYQQQVLGTASTANDGKAVISTKENPFVLVAKNGAQRGYLQLSDGRSLSLSNFDVSGEVVKKGLKGFLYGERGVWRPGDSLYLSFILEDKNKLLPPAHPVVLELQNPQGQLVNRLVRSTSENGFYNFATATEPDAPTGNWTARVKVGGIEFLQPIKIETVKPNRLKINLDFGMDKITRPSVSGNLEVKWLHGAPGRNLKAEFEVLLAKAPTKFSKYPDYIFEDPSRQFSSEAESIFSGSTNVEGKAVINATLSSSYAAPGFLNAIFKGKVFEESGNFSIDRFSIPYYPYNAYVGIRLPKGEKYSGMLYTDSTHKVDVVTVDANGSGVSKSVEMSIYKLNWRWWWDNSYDDIANYVESSYSKLIKSGTVTTTNGKGVWNFQIKNDWGRYFVRACDSQSGHCTGKIIYVDEPGWYSRSRDENNRGGATMLSFSTNKEIYNIGEKINLTIPSSAQGRALVSVESGSKIIQTYWVETQPGETRFSIDASAEMTPNVYIHVSLLQPHAQTENDLPIRLYGVTAIRVEDPATHLEPVIQMPDVLEPGERVNIKISEKSKRKMTYTVAMVDEGLLDLTRFKTPDAWSRFFAREALGVRTWDLYDDVMGAFGARLERLLAIGGDAELAAKDDDPRANRFKPVVKFFGPFTLDKGQTKTHSFIMPQYIGSVKTMVVAGYDGAYGNTDKVTPVRKPLMVLATLPRVLGPEEKLKLPVTLFTQEKGISNVKVEVKAKGPVSVVGETTKSVSMNASGDMTIDFDLSVQSSTGIAKIEVVATSGNFKGTDVIEIEIRNPNLPVSRVTEQLLDAGQRWDTAVNPFGISGTNSAMLEVSSLPPVNLGSRLRYLMQYPYGCIEQTTSSVFPQLFIDQVKVLNDEEKARVQRNVTAGIERLKSFVTRDGGFAYWPGGEDANSWGTSYGGHFLIEAEAKGYFVQADILKHWKKYQKNQALEWRRNNQYVNSDLMQAYRLYTLALAGAPELGAMNRLREMGDLPATAAWMLASAYVKAGQPDAAKKLVANLSSVVKPYRELGYTFGSDVRDRALILETLSLLGDRNKGFELLKEISSTLSNENSWMSTQEVAYCLKAVAVFAGQEKRGTIKFKYTLNDGKTISASTELPIAQVPITIDGVKKGNVNIVNEGTGLLYSRLMITGTPARGNEEDVESNLNVTVVYKDKDGNIIDPTKLEQGREFVAEVTVIHPGVRSNYENMALAQVFPSGWEINNLRLDETESALANSIFTYQDIRDDRVYTYFNLRRNEKKVFRVSLTASYAGSFYLPAVSCEAMYDRSIYARKKGQPVEVVKEAGVQ